MGTAEDPTMPIEGAWRVASIDGRPALGGPEATIEFHADGRVAGGTGLNRFAGSWTIEDGSLVLGPLATTLMAGPPERMEQERRVFEILSAPIVVTRDGEALTMDGVGRLDLTRIEHAAEDTQTRRRVAGTATYRERIMPPPGSHLTVRVVDVSLAEVPAPVVAEGTYELPNVPMAFELFVDPDAIDEQRHYAIRADIHDTRGLLWTTETVYPVLTLDSPETSDLVLVAVPADPTGSRPSPGRT